MDSKLYPLTESESTSGIEFCKSTRKIIAASRTTYEKSSGCSAGSEISLAQFDDNDLTEPLHKRSEVEYIELGKLDRIVDPVLQKLTFIDDLKHVFQWQVQNLLKAKKLVQKCQRMLLLVQRGGRGAVG